MKTFSRYRWGCDTTWSNTGVVCLALAALIGLCGCSSSPLGDESERTSSASAGLSVSGDVDTVEAHLRGGAAGPAILGVLPEGADLVWYQATPGLAGSVVSQGPGEPLVLGCESPGEAVDCDWTVEMLLLSTEPLTAWAQDLTGDSADAAVLAVAGFTYDLAQFTTPLGSEVFGTAPDLLVNTGASSPAEEGVPAGEYTLMSFNLSFSFDGVDTTARLITTDVGDSGWSDSLGAAPLIQFADNTAVEANAGGTLPNAVIVINPTIAVEVCDDGEDNDGDELIDCDDPDCSRELSCDPPPVISCPQDLTVECDGEGNIADFDAWAAGGPVDNICEDLSTTGEFTEFSGVCALAVSTTGTWTATDACGVDSCSATFTVADTTPPTVVAAADATLECDGLGNQLDLEAWLADAGADDVCGEVTLSNDFTGLTDECGETGTASVTWTATDDCGNVGTGIATVAIVDTAPPVPTGAEDLAYLCEDGYQADLEAWLASAAADDACGSASLENDFSGISEQCDAVVTWTATDECGNGTAYTGTFTIVDDTPPVITLNGSAEVTLQCSVDSYAEQGAEATDACDQNLAAVGVGGDTVDEAVPGTYVVTFGVTDLCGNSAEQATRTVEVVDTIPPEITVGPMIEMWPPNHKYWTFELSDCVESVVDGCGGAMDVNSVGTIISMYSDEPENTKGNGAGSTGSDMILAGDGWFEVRAERSGQGNGRVYGVTFTVSDAAGNTAIETCYVGVPHDQSGDPPVDDGLGAGYAVP